jgi:CheY-like chemotaxis protein
MDLGNCRILLLEDDPLISIDGEDMLRSLGAAAVHAVHSLADAMARLEGEAIDAAVLDVRIGSSRSDDFARELAGRGVPFIMTSGYGREAAMPEGLAGVPLVGKPYSAEALRAAFASIGPVRRIA